MAKANPNSTSGEKTGQINDLNIYDMLDSTYTALFGLQYLLEHTIEYTTGFPAMAGAGISELFRREVDDLAEVKSYVGDMLDRLKAAEKTAAAPRSALPDDMINLPVYYPGIEKDLAGNAKTQHAPDFGQIAQDTNVEEATVRRVVQRLLADPRAAMDQKVRHEP